MIKTIDPVALREAADEGFFDGKPWWGGEHCLRAVTVSRSGLVSVDESVANAYTQMLFILAEARCPRRDLPVWKWGFVGAAYLRELAESEAFAYKDWDNGNEALDWPMRIAETAEEFVRRFCQVSRKQ